MTEESVARCRRESAAVLHAALRAAQPRQSRVAQRRVLMRRAGRAVLIALGVTGVCAASALAWTHATLVRDEFLHGIPEQPLVLKAEPWLRTSPNLVTSTNHEPSATTPE